MSIVILQTTSILHLRSRHRLTTFDRQSFFGLGRIFLLGVWLGRSFRHFLPCRQPPWTPPPDGFLRVGADRTASDQGALADDIYEFALSITSPSMDS